ncbi:MAG: hypothetical protein U5K43_02890 [Halofilum sp. (in: g-proteobacteria)]|nr:hypothetical protein [Halofilum sp. (in: g-proteobacteria)]
MSAGVPPPDAERLQRVAAARGTSEYDTFVHAWSAWHGEAAPAGRIDADFATYLRTQAVPPYVRHFVRTWLAHHPGVVDEHLRERRALRRARLLALALIVLAVGAAMLAGRLL